MRPAARALALGEVALAAAIWATSFVGIRYVVRQAPPLTVAGLRYSLAFFILLPFALRKGGVPSGGRLVRLGLIGMVQYTLGNGALFLALRWASSTAGALTQSLAPLLTLAIEARWGKERFSLPAVLGVALAVGGSAGFFSPEVGGGMPALALFLLGVTTLAFALFPVLVRREGNAVGTVALTAWPLGCGGLALLALSAGIEGPPALSLPSWGIVVGMALVNTVMAYLLFTHALSRLRATEANVVLNLSPLGTAAIARWTLGETPSLGQVVSLLLVIMGVGLAQYRGRVDPQGGSS